jgi:hypothetical protein
MTRKTVTLSGRVPEPVKKRINEMAEEREISQSMMMREIIKEGIEYEEADTEPVQPESLRKIIQEELEEYGDSSVAKSTEDAQYNGSIVWVFAVGFGVMVMSILFGIMILKSNQESAAVMGPGLWVLWGVGAVLIAIVLKM